MALATVCPLRSREPPESVTEPEPRAPEAPRRRVPSETEVPPVWVLAADRVQVPAPDLVSEPEPEKALLKLPVPAPVRVSEGLPL